MPVLGFGSKDVVNRACAMSSTRTYLLLVFLPYLFLIFIFHIQLQMPMEQTVSRVREGEHSLADFNRMHVAVDPKIDKDSFHFRDLLIKDSNDDLHALRNGRQRTAINSGLSHYRRPDTTERRYQFEVPGNRDESTAAKLIMVSRTFENGTHRVQEMVRMLDRDLQRLELDGASEALDLDTNGAPFGVRLGRDPNENIHAPLTEECSHQLKRTRDAVDGFNLFHYVGGVHIMSAYLDARFNDQPPFVRMIGLISRDQTPELYCHFQHGSTNGTVTSFASELALFYEMCENHNKERGGWIISCKVPSVFTDRDELPCRLFVSEQSTRHRNSVGGIELPIYTTSPVRGKGSLSGFGVCVPPLFGHIPSTTLIEFVELSRLLGARHLVFYVHRVTIAVKKVLEYYQERGLITVIDWDLPVRDKDIWYHGQLLAINDCLYRSMHRFTHVVFNDVDEFLVPHQHDTWQEMIQHLESNNNRTHNRTQYSGFSFQSAFFDPLVNGNSKILYDLESDLRTKIFSGVRTKVMVRPLRIFELGIHHISRPLRERYVKRSVDPNIAFIHHYRKCMMDFDPRMKCQVYARDETLLRYIPTLRHNVHQTLWILKELDRLSRQSLTNRNM